MPANIDLSTLSPLVVPATNPLIATKTGTPNWRAGERDATFGFDKVINFDDWPDWTSGQHSIDRVQRVTTHTFSAEMIRDWVYSCRQDPLYAPSKGDLGNREAVEIVAADAIHSKSGTGRVVRCSREADTPPQDSYPQSDCLLFFLIPPEMRSDEIYLEFDIKFGANWTANANELAAGIVNNKFFRMGYWSLVGNEHNAFNDGELGPMSLLNWKVDSYQTRNLVSFRGGPPANNYYCSADVPLTNQNAWNGDWVGTTNGMAYDGGYPKIPDRVNGGYITDNLTQKVMHPQIYGTDEYNTIGIYMKMNSANGVADGIYRQFFNGEQTVKATAVRWWSGGAAAPPKWNFFEIGGNAFFDAYDAALKREEPYYFDELRYKRGLPQLLIDRIAAG